MASYYVHLSVDCLVRVKVSRVVIGFLTCLIFYRHILGHHLLCVHTLDIRPIHTQKILLHPIHPKNSIDSRDRLVLTKFIGCKIYLGHAQLIRKTLSLACL